MIYLGFETEYLFLQIFPNKRVFYDENSNSFLKSENFYFPFMASDLKDLQTTCF